ncbi:sn-glycerol 3-phosphate transport system substrate-binding protein [Streptosporangium album]|uniref:sn-glycerol 3-phosphate transport system substrate-binding protein n=1 Tax=Streptosporangium album TaxID=47479 RepID=A0A7W7WEV0_9ACTN|nr:ABC transporter substrate-binding protein [Streptosporangium album]MBB4943830.1 sn-glycerol 3-phosphate transport system substrate-binding protein [Streptosporangium album]
MNTSFSSFNRRQFLGTAGAGLLAFTSVGCGGGSGAGMAQPEGKVPGQYAKRQRIVIWFPWTGGPGEAFQRLVAKFNGSQNDIYVEAQFQGTYDETTQKLATALQARQIPDLCVFSDVTWNKFYLNDTLEPLNGYFGKGLKAADYTDQLIAEGTVKNEVWWVPFARSTPIFYYNKDLFDAAGLPDRGPKTWSELREWAPALTAQKVAGQSPKLTAYAQIDGDWQFQGTVWQWGGNYSKGLEVTVDTGGAVEAGEWQRKLIHDDKLAYMAQSPKLDFTNGLIATLTESTGALTGITKDAPFKVGTAFLPEETAFGCPTGGGGISVMAGAPKERKQAAFEFLTFLAKPENAAQWTIDTGYLPATKAAAATPQMQKLFTDNPNFKKAVDQLPKTHEQDQVRLQVPNANRVLYGGLQKIYADNQPAAAVFKTVAEELRKSTESVRKTIERRM